MTCAEAFKDDGTHSVACEKCNVWQHSACLGISQVEAEKDDFHFICHDCKRRAEDAKKPKIPALKFHLGSSSSPPSQKAQDVCFSINVPVKRKSEDEATNMPPTKNFKYSEPKNPAVNLPAPERSQAAQIMHKVVLNGPTLVPKGQVSPPHLSGNPAQPPAPPGFESTAAPHSKLNGNADRTQIQNGSPSPSLKQSPDPLSATANGSAEKPVSVGWSARYSFSQASKHFRQDQYPSSQDLFLNSFDPPRLGSSSSANSTPPTKSRLSLSPPQKGRNGVHVKNFPTDENFPNHLPSATQSPAYSPVKNQSSPPMTSIHVSSSPIIHPPLQQNPSSPPGFSPTKQSPPRSSKTSDVASTPVLPPVQALSPSPRAQVLQAPVKRFGSGDATLANGHINGE